MTRRIGRCVAVALVAVLGAATAVGDTRVAMRSIYAALGELLPLSLSESRFESPANRDRVEVALTRMIGNVEALRGHGRSLPMSYEFLRQTLANDARQAAESFRLGHFEAARFLVGDLVNACFGCHTRLAETEGFELGAELLAQPGVTELPLADRAMLAAATRQFDQALDLYETLFAAADESPSEIAYGGAFESYLKVVLRVRGDFDRATRVFTRFLGRDDVPAYLRIHVRSWLNALAGIGAAERPSDDFDAGRLVFREALLQRMFPEDPRALVHFIEASRLLHRFVQAHSASAAQDAVMRERLGEAYYLLGVAESHITSNYWYSETEYFLESSIRLSPGSGFASQAYAWLEEDALLGYSGSAGLELPEAVADYLAELRRLIETGKPAVE